ALADVDAAPGLADALDPVDQRSPRVVVADPEYEARVALLLFDPHRIEEARALQHARDRKLLLRRGTRGLRVARHSRVADARQHVCDRIGHHGPNSSKAGTACRAARAAP